MRPLAEASTLPSTVDGPGTPCRTVCGQDGRIRAHGDVFRACPARRARSARRGVNSTAGVAGFTLIEMVVGIVLIGSVVALLQAVVFPQFTRSVNPLFTIRAAELAQSLAEEILAKPFDELTPLGGAPPCNPCSAIPLGTDGGESARADFDDVDDYAFYCGGGSGQFAVENALGVAPTDYSGFRMQICVDYDGDYDGIADADASNPNAKLVRVKVWAPTADGAEVLQFDFYRGNF